MPVGPEIVDTFRLEDPVGVEAPGNGVTAHWHRARRDGRRSRHGIVLLPILGGDYAVSTSFARFFAARGYQCLRFERRAEWLDAGRDPMVLGILLDQYADDVRRGIARWKEMGGPAPELGLFGVSMGAITGTVVAAREPAIGPSVLCLGGGPLAEVLATGRDEEFDRFRTDLSARLGCPEEDLLPSFQASLEGRDPLTLAGRLDRSRTLCVAARFDHVVRHRLQVRLWEALGRPSRITLPCGHYSAIVFVPLIRHVALGWFDRHFAAVGDPS